MHWFSRPAGLRCTTWGSWPWCDLPVSVSRDSSGTFDLVVLIQLATVLQRMALGDSPAEGFTFLATVLTCHLGLARLSTGSHVVRKILRGEPQVLVRDGLVLHKALESEGLSRDDLLAGLRKQGYASPADVKLAVLEETGHLSAVPRDD